MAEIDPPDDQAHFGCPVCGSVLTLPHFDQDETPYCLHSPNHTYIWPWFARTLPVDATSMERVKVSYD